MVTCYPICAIAAGLVGSQIPFLWKTKQDLVTHEFVATLDDNQRAIYQTIVEERFRIFMVGSLLGILLGIAYLWYAMRMKLHVGMRVCVALVIFLGVPYMYYSLAPKSQWMLNHLNDQKQVNEWLDVYRFMKWRCHIGFLLGVVGYLLLCLYM